MSILTLSSTLQDAQSLLNDLSAKWPSDAEVIQQSHALWESDLSYLDPQWAQVCSQAINWIDQVPLALMTASKHANENGAADGYAEIAASLDDLLKQVNGKKGFDLVGRMLGKKFSPADHLEYLLSQKKTLDEDSVKRLSEIRRALDLGDEARQLAALLIDATPALSAEVHERRRKVEGEDASTAFAAQKALRTLKMLDRAQGAIAIVKERAQHELSQNAAVSRQSLENMVSREEKMHARISASAAQISRAIANGQVEKEKGAEPVKVQLANSTQLMTGERVPSGVRAVPDAPESKGFFKRILGRTDASSMNEFSNALEKSQSGVNGNEESLSKEMLARLKKVKKSAKEGRFEVVEEMNRVISDYNIKASTRFDGQSMIDFFLSVSSSKVFVTSPFTKDRIVETLALLLLREPRITSELCDWKSVSSVMTDNFKYLSHEKRTLAAAAMMKAHKFVEFGGALEGVVECAVENYKRLTFGMESTNAFLNEKCPPKVLEGVLGSLAVTPENKSILWVLSKRLRAELASTVARVMIDQYTMGLVEADKEKFLISTLLPSDQRDLIRKLMRSDPSNLSTRATIRNILDNPEVKSAASNPFDAVHFWCASLSDWASSYKMITATQGFDTPDASAPHIVHHKAPARLIAAALSSGLPDMWQRVQGLSSTPVLDSALNLNVLSKSPFSILLNPPVLIDTNRTLLGLPKFDHAYWSQLLVDHIETPTVREFQPSETTFQAVLNDLQSGGGLEGVEHRLKMLDELKKQNIPMTPLMEAAYLGDIQWIKALVDAGADRHAGISGYTPVSMLKEAVFKQIERLSSLQLVSSASRASLFVEKMTSAMNETGLWDIAAASPKNMEQEMLVAAASLDLTDRESISNMARKKAIIECISKMGRSKFMATIGYMVGPSGETPLHSVEVRHLLDYGAKAGVLPKEYRLEDLKEEIESARVFKASPVKMPEWSSKPFHMGP